MLKLVYNDFTDENTFTSKIMNKHQEEIKRLEKKLARIKFFNFALTNYLRTHGEMDFELYNCAVAWFEHSDLSVTEIFQKITEIDLQAVNPVVY